MPNVCLEVDGAQVVLATASDANHPPESVIDGSDDTFWVTTGLFPQELIISFPQPMRITSLETRTAAIKALSLHKSAAQTPSSWEDLSTSELAPSEGHLQIVQHKINPAILRHLRIVIKSGYEPFCAVYSIKAEGMPIE